MAGPFVPRLPTWNLECQAYTLDPETGTRSAGAGFVAQMYPPLRGSDQVGASDAYLVYPKESNALHDPTEYDNVGMDAVVFSWNGQTWGWLVQQVLPRWAGFPNQHYLALLKRMTATELENILISLSNQPDGIAPNFNLEMELLKLDEFTPTYTSLGVFNGEFKAMEPMAEVVGLESNFAFFPKSVGVLPNPADFGDERAVVLRFDWHGRSW